MPAKPHGRGCCVGPEATGRGGARSWPTVCAEQSRAEPSRAEPSRAFYCRPPQVLHGRVGSAFGDLGSYDYFTLGGPHSVRGYAPGELGACR